MPGIESPADGRTWRHPYGPPPPLTAVRGRRPPGPTGRGRRRRVVVATLLFFAFFALLFWVITWLLRPQPVRIVLLAAGYEQNLAVPHNVPGRRWADELAAAGGGHLRSADPTATEFRSKARWDVGLRGVRERAVLVAFAAHGGSDADGPYLLPTDAAPGPGGGNRLRVDAVLTRLADLPAGTKKVLVLDATQVESNPLFGMLGNDFAGGLDRLADRIEGIPNLVVVSASGPGERSWVDESQGRTAFGHHLLAGLAGAADANTDRRVSLWELHEYVSTQVKEWAARHRAAVQQPQIYPRGPEGERRAKAVILAVISADAPPAAPESAKPFEPSPALRAAWAKHHDLNGQDPHPAAHGPFPWREYEATVLRYEQLLAAGDERSAAEVAKRLPTLEQDLAARRRIELRSVGATLAMPAVAGVAAPTADQAAVRKFEALWSAPADERKKRLDDFVAAPGRPLLYTMLLDQAIADPAANLGKAAELARLAGDGGARPAEVHFLVMLARHLPPGALPARGNRVKTSLQVRKVMEQVAVPETYAEQVRPWLEARLRAADADRAVAEDLLFATAEPDLTESDKRFAAVLAAYVRLRFDTDQLRTAFGVRDGAFAVLPYYAQWAADHPENPESKTTKVEEAWRKAHSLAAGLRQPPDRSPAELARLAGDLGEDFAWLSRQVALEIKSLLPVPPVGANPITSAQTIRALLLLPNLSPDDRLKLLAVADRLARDPVTQQGSDDPRSPDPVPSAKRYGTLALAALGPWAFDTPAVKDRPTFVVTQARLTGLAGEADATRALTEIGTAIAGRLVRLPADVRIHLDRARFAKLPDVRADHRAADLFTRALPAGLSSPDPDATTALRRLLVQDLLVAQATRSAEQAWAADEPNDEPYFRAAGRAFLADVAALRPEEAVRETVRAAEARLDAPLDLTLSAPARVPVVDDAPFAVEVEVASPPRADVLPGRVLLWTGPASPDVALTPAAAPGRTARPALGTHRYRVELDSPRMADTAPTPAAVQTTVAVRAFFRGRVVERTAPIDLFPRPDVLVRYRPPPASAAVAVRAPADLARRYGIGEGAVAIVLDCSGSMAAPPGRSPEDSRLKQGVRAVARLLAKLPRDTEVTVWAFGQAGDAGKRVDAAEKTILRVLDPVRWDPDNPEALAALTARLDKLEAFNESPLFRTVLTARADILSVAGYRAVVMVTDGIDNRFAVDRELNRSNKGPIEAVRDRLMEGGVALHVVGFPPRSDDEVKARAALAEFVTELPVPGKYVDVSDVDALADALRLALSPRLRCRLTDADRADSRVTFLDVATGTADRWPQGRFVPGRYLLSSASPAVSTPLALRPGDNLLVTMAATPRGPRFRRDPFAADYPWKPFADSDGGDWRMAVLQNQGTKAGGMQMLVTLEKTDGAVELARPAETWIEVGTDLETTAPAAVEWAPAWGYPAPAWDVNVPRWPTYSATGSPARPLVRVWWYADRPARSAAEVPLADLFRGSKTIRVGADEVTVGPATLDRRPAAPGEPARTAPAVVVRVVYPAGRPVIARLDGVAVDGYEHRLFLRAGRYTGVFWPSAGGTGATVSLIPLAEFKAGARRIEVRDLAPPDPNDDRPRPVEGK